MNGRLKNLLESSRRNPLYAYRSFLGRFNETFKLDYNFLNGSSFLPHTIRIDPTYRCNLRCKGCFEFGEELSEISKAKNPESRKTCHLMT